MCKTTVAPSDGLRTTLNNVVYFVIYVIVYRIRLVKFRSNIYSSLLLCSWVSKCVTKKCSVFFRFPNDADRFIFVNETHPLDDCDKIVLFLAQFVSK